MYQPRGGLSDEMLADHAKDLVMMIKYFCDDRWWLADVQSSRMKDYPQAEALAISDPLVTVTTLVDLWQLNLEDANYHSMMDMPDNLVMTLKKNRVSKNVIKHVLWDIIEAGGWIA